MSNKNKSIVPYVIGIYLLLFIVLYVIPVWIGNIYGENYRYEVIIAIIIGLPLSYLLLLEKVAKNQFRKKSETYEFEANRKKDHENKVESQKAVFRFIHQKHIRSDMGKIKERYFNLSEYSLAKSNLEKAKEKLSNIELFTSLLKVIALWVAAFHFFHSINNNQIGGIEKQIGNMVEQSEFTRLQDSVAASEEKISYLEEELKVLGKQLGNKLEQKHITDIRDSIRLNYIISSNNKRNLRPVVTRVEKLEEHFENEDSIFNNKQR